MIASGVDMMMHDCNRGRCDFLIVAEATASECTIAFFFRQEHTTGNSAFADDADDADDAENMNNAVFVDFPWR
jgi:hypothetical protein